MFESFSHYLSYGATDQRTVRELANAIDGLVVPGTVAAFQREGTGGFVLSLSASAAAPDYVIDSRFPLFQQALLSAKTSHHALAELLGAPQLVSTRAPAPEELSDQVVEVIAQNWIAFNRGYSTERMGKFNKYAERLDEPVGPENVRLPLYVLPPYAAADGVDDPWWAVSQRLFDASVQASGDLPCVRVIAAKEARFLDGMLEQVGNEDRVVVWVSGLQELETDTQTLASYGRALQAATARGQATFALYGGFLSVLFAAVGLAGSSHGIGYGEYRDWIELPRSGPPPARYYLPILHRYVSQELAYQLWLANRLLAQCSCSECNGAPPVALDYHALMKHSVLCRAEEISRWVGTDLSETAERLEREFMAFMRGVEQASLSVLVQRQAEHSATHMLRWAETLRRLALET